MTFVNQVAEIVHGVVHETWGAAAKHYGDYFLVVWRIREEMHVEQAELSQAPFAQLADMAMYAFARILGSLRSSREVDAYRNHPALMQRFGRHTHFTVSSGLHYGWVIEGAVGSEYKIDPSYLSPNVSIVESVESATSHYGVQIMICETVHDLCSDQMASKCRMIDRALLAGSSKPLGLYTLDLDVKCLSVESPPPLVHWSTAFRFKVMNMIEVQKLQLLTSDVSIVFDEDEDIQKMRTPYVGKFLPLFNMGFENYREGEWPMARRLLSRTRTMLGFVDGPSVALLRFMDSHDYVAPSDWVGVRDLHTYRATE